MDKLSATNRSLREISETIQYAAHSAVVVSELAIEEFLRCMLNEPADAVIEHIIRHYLLASGQKVEPPETRAFVADQFRDLSDKQMRESQGLLSFHPLEARLARLDRLINDLSTIDLKSDWIAAESKFASANLELAKTNLSTSVVSVDGCRDHCWHAVLRNITLNIRSAPRLLLPSSEPPEAFTTGLITPTATPFIYALELRPETIQKYLERATTELHQAESMASIAVSRDVLRSPKGHGKMQGQPSRNEDRDKWVYDYMMEHGNDTYQKIAENLANIASQSNWETLDAGSIYNTALRYWERNKEKIIGLKHPRVRKVQ